MARPGLMALVVGALAIGLGALLLRPAADPAETARARDRVAAALAVATPQPTMAGATAGARRPSAFAQPTQLALPPALTLSPEIAALLPADSPEADLATSITVGDRSRQLVYRLGDGRTFVVLQSGAGSGRPFMSSYSLDEGSVRGWPAQFYTTRSRSLRSMISWTEGRAAYLMYSASLSVRDLVRLAEQLR
jgi:hypothetical protein